MFSMALIGILGSLAQWLAWWLRLPSILILLVIGIAIGQSGLGWINPDEMFGDVLFPLVSLAVSVILFEGALTLNFKQIKGIENVVRRMVSVGVIVTWLTISIATHWLLDIGWQLAFLFGSLVVVTGPTVVEPMLRTLNLNKKLSNVLRWEGIVIDPVGAILAVLVFNFIVANLKGAEGWLVVAQSFGMILLVGTLLGVASGWLLSQILKRHLLPEFLHNVFVLTLVFITFSAAHTLAHESGLLAVTVMGMWLANQKDIDITEILHFKKSLTILLISGLFVVLAARLQISQLIDLGWAAVMLLVVIQFLARPLKIALSTWQSDLTLKEKATLAWIAPRGIVAAAVSALFALRLEQLGVENAPLLVSMTFMVIIGTVVFQSMTTGWLARKLGVANPNSNGVLIIGGNPVALLVAEAVKKEGFDVIVTDSNWRNIHDARMKGIRSYFGNPVSAHADHHLDLVGIGQLFALSMNHDLNLHAVNRYKSEFGYTKTYMLAEQSDGNQHEKHSISRKGKARVLFDREVNYDRLSGMVQRGWRIKTTTLTDSYGIEQYQAAHPEAVVMFALNPNDGTMRVVTNPHELEFLKAKWKVMALSPPQENTESS